MIPTMGDDIYMTEFFEPKKRMEVAASIVCFVERLKFLVKTAGRSKHCLT